MKYLKLYIKKLYLDFLQNIKIELCFLSKLINVDIISSKVIKKLYIKYKYRRKIYM